MTERWCWFYVFDIKPITYMNHESEMKKIKWLVSKTLGWDVCEMIAHMCADECLEKRYFE